MDAFDWVDAQLADHGQRRTGVPVRHHAMPWSTVWRIPTTLGDLWLKRNGIGTGYEPALLGILADSRAVGVPDVVAVETVHGWSLTRDAGTPMRALPGGEDAAHWAPALRLYAQVQRHVEARVPDLIAAGVPDHRPAGEPARAQALLADDAAMRRGQPEGLTPEVERHVRAALPQLADWCAELATSPVPVTLQHDDLHANNVLLDGSGRMTVIDWGDAQVAHPFATMLTTMRSIAHHTGLAGPGDPRLEPLREAYLEAWADVADMPRLRRDAWLAERIAPVARADAWRRALLGADERACAEHGGAVPGWLGELP